MFKQIFDNELVTIEFADNEKIAVIKWKETCGNIINKQHTKIFNDIRDLITDIAPDKMLVDMSGCDYNITPDSGAWFENPIFAMYADLPPSRIALIIPQNLFVNAFFDAARAYEKIGPNTSLQYFKDADKAWDWLKS
ncbi:MAG: hypothetical protein R6U11_11815 [Bacteroidales bacterium]